MSPAVPGNLPTGIRSQVRNPDGSTSTVDTISIGVDGKEVLIPTVIGGRHVSREEAEAHYRRTGENFGAFNSVDDANAYAKSLHDYHGRLLQNGGSAGDLDAVTEWGESRGKRYGKSGRLLTSPAGALGEMQVMPATARNPGFGLRPASTGNPDDLARLGREYRAAMQQRYGGDLQKMWGAYNAGPGRVDALVAQHGTDWLRYAPADTRAYVADNLRRLQATRGY